MENNNSNNQIGVINEQGFVAGYGLGFNTLNEQDRDRINKKKEEDTKNNSKK